MDDGTPTDGGLRPPSTPRTNGPVAGPATAPPRLGRPGDPLPVRSGRQLLMVLGTMAVFFLALVLLATWGAKNG